MADINIPTLQDFIAITKQQGFARTNRFAVMFSAPIMMSNGPWQIRDLALLCQEVSFPAKTIGTRSLRINALTEQRAHTVDFSGDSITFTFIVDQSWQTRLFFEEWFRLMIGQSSANDASLPSGPMREVEFYSNYIQDIQIASLSPFSDAIAPAPVGSNFVSGLVSDAKALATSTANTLTASLKGNILGKSVSSIAQQVLGGVENLLLAPNTSAVPEPPTRIAEVPIYTVTLHECFPKSMDAQPMSSETPNQFHKLRISFAYKYYTTAEQLPEQTQNVNLSTVPIPFNLPF